MAVVERIAWVIGDEIDCDALIWHDIDRVFDQAADLCIVDAGYPLRL